MKENNYQKKNNRRTISATIGAFIGSQKALQCTLCYVCRDDLNNFEMVPGAIIEASSAIPRQKIETVEFETNEQTVWVDGKRLNTYDPVLEAIEVTQPFLLQCHPSRWRKINTWTPPQTHSHRCTKVV